MMGMDKQTARDLRQLAKLHALVVAALEIRDRRYSVKTTLDREDRSAFDRFNQAVDAWQYEDVNT